MSGELLAVLIAGGIAVLPTIVSSIVGMFEKKNTQEHELQLRKMEFYEKPKAEAVFNYLENLGKVTSNARDYDFIRDYTAAYVKASALVDTEVYVEMNRMHQLIMEWYRSKESNSDLPFHHSEDAFSLRHKMHAYIESLKVDK